MQKEPIIDNYVTAWPTHISINPSTVRPQLLPLMTLPCQDFSFSRTGLSIVNTGAEVWLYLITKFKQLLLHMSIKTWQSLNCEDFYILEYCDCNSYPQFHGRVFSRVRNTEHIPAKLHEC